MVRECYTSLASNEREWIIVSTVLTVDVMMLPSGCMILIGKRIVVANNSEKFLGK